MNYIKIHSLDLRNTFDFILLYYVIEKENNFIAYVFNIRKKELHSFILIVSSTINCNILSIYNFID